MQSSTKNSNKFVKKIKMTGERKTFKASKGGKLREDKYMKGN